MEMAGLRRMSRACPASVCCISSLPEGPSIELKIYKNEISKVSIPARLRTDLETLGQISTGSRQDLMC